MSKVKDITGQTFGRLTAIAPANKNKNVHVFWEFVCDCGNPEVLLCVADHVTSGDICSCGCLPPDVANRQRFRDLSGEHFGRLTALCAVGKSRHGKFLWKCSCICNTVVVVIGGDLVSGKTVSCGCLSRENVVERNTSHGLAHTRAYRIWAGMIQRCINPAVGDAWDDYGGRGIKVCDRWLHSFLDFLEDMGHPPSSKHSIDRINNDGDYESGNCRWATREEQANNRRNNVLITSQGKTQTVAQWALELGVSAKMIHHRLKAGASSEELLSPPRETMTFTYQGKTQTVREWALKLGLSEHTVRYRLELGVSLEELTAPPRTATTLTYKGRTQTIAQWATDLGIHVNTIRGRIKDGFSVPEILSKCKLSRRPKVFLTHQGKTQTVEQWAMDLRISVSTIRGRLRKGFSPSEALSMSRLPRRF